MANQFTRYTGTVTGQVGSLITALDAILVTGQSWTKTAGTNIAAYRAPSGSRLYLYVDDSASGTGGAKEAIIAGYETITSVPPGGTNPFPTNGQAIAATTGVVCRKSVSADGTARTYKAFADSRSILFFLQSDTAGTYYSFQFGEFYSFVTSDAYNCSICGRVVLNSGATTPERLCDVVANANAGNNLYVARSYLGTGTSVNMGRHSDTAKMLSNLYFVGGLAYPNPSDGAIYTSRVWIHDSTTAPANSIRGQMRGLWVPLHAVASYNDGDTFSGTGNLAGYTFEIVKSVPNNLGNLGVAAVETSATLLTN